jgi:hypothetical protein
MPSWGSFSYAFGPLIALAGVSILALIARWAFSSGTSLVARPAQRGSADSYGLMRPVAAPMSAAEAEYQRLRLTSAGIRCNVANTTDGPRVMVWVEDLERAKLALR